VPRSIKLPPYFFRFSGFGEAVADAAGRFFELPPKRRHVEGDFPADEGGVEFRFVLKADDDVTPAVRIDACAGMVRASSPE